MLLDKIEKKIFQNAFGKLHKSCLIKCHLGLVCENGFGTDCYIAMQGAMISITGKLIFKNQAINTMLLKRKNLKQKIKKNEINLKQQQMIKKTMIGNVIKHRYFSESSLQNFFSVKFCQ